MKVAPQFRRYIESDYTNLKVDPELVDLDIHEPDSSHSTRMELEELESIVAEAKLPPKIMRVADKSPLSLFYAVAKKKGLDPLEEEAREWAEDWTKLSFELKFKFKRRRPYEVKREHDIDFVVDKSDTTESPSYPSGHAMMGYGVAEFYKDKYPLMSEEWDNVADIIAHSRLQMGVHYPSDVKASKRVVEQLAGAGVKMASHLDLEVLFEESGPLTKLASYANFLTRLTPEARAAFRQFRGRGKSQTSWVSDFNRWAQETGQDASRLFSNQRDSRRYATMNSSAYQDYVNYTTKNRGSTFSDWRQAGGSRGGNPITPAQMLRNKPTGGYTPPQLQSRKPVTISSGNKAPGQGTSSISQPVPKVNNTPAPTNTPTPGATPPEVAKPIGFFRGAGQAIKNNPGKTAIGFGGAGIVGYKVSEDRSKEAALPNVNSILKATESGLAKLKLPELADKVDLYRARRNLSRAVKDLHKYESVTGRFGQMPRIVIPKSHLDVPDLYRLGFQDSLIAVPEIGQKTWTTYRHPLDKLHLHDHGKYLNMHIDSLPSLQMIAERNSLTAKARRKLMETIPEGVKAWRPGKSKDVGFLKKLDDQVSGLGHAMLEGGPGYLNYALKQLNPWKVGMAEEILSKLPKDYLKKRYGITKVSSEQSKLAAPKINQQLLKKVIAGTNRAGFLTSGDTTPPLEADPNFTDIVPPKPKRKRQDLEEIVRLVKDEIAKASPEDMEYSKLVASGLPMEEIVARELVDPFTSRDNWTLTPEEYKQFRYSVIKDKKKLYPVARPYALAERYGIDLGLPEDVAQRNARMHPAFANFSYPSFHTARGAFLAETARDLVPEDQQHLVDDLIARIGRSRIQQGVHSHQDVEAGEAMGREAAKIYKELGIKTSAYKDYRPRGTLYLLDGKGGIMADKPTADYNSTTPYFFPGGGIFEEEKVDRLPTRDEIIEGVEREALEELGTKLKNVRVLQDEPVNVDMPDWWRERQRKKRGLDYKGISEFFAAAERGDQDKSIYGADNDEFKGTFYPIEEVASALEANAKPGDDYYEDSMRQARLIRSLLEKTSEDQFQASSSPEKNVRTVPEFQLRNALSNPSNGLHKNTPESKQVIKSELTRRKAIPQREYFRGGQKEIDAFRDEVSATYNPSPGSARGLRPGTIESMSQANRAGDNLLEYMAGDAAAEYPYQLGQYRARLTSEGPYSARYMSPYIGIGLRGRGDLRPNYQFGPTSNKDGTAYVNPIIAAHEYAHGRFGMHEHEADAYAATTNYDLHDLAKFYLSGGDIYTDEDHDPLGGNPYLGDKERLQLLASRFDNGGMEKTQSVNDLSVLTAVPTQNLDLIMRKGLYSQKAMLDDPEVMAAFLAQRNADKAWKNDEQYDEKRFREQYDKRVELMEGEDAPLAGPSVFFTEPDPDKVSDPRHFVNKFDTQKLRVNLGKLLADIPETRITGAELIPSSAAENMTDEEFDQYVKDRRRDITPEEAAKYIATDPKELWKHYKDEYLGRYYAADVPHAFIRTPSGIIPPEYLEKVEKTSSAYADMSPEVAAKLREALAKKKEYQKQFDAPEDPSRIYHGSPSKIDKFETRPHYLADDEPVVFGTPSRTQAISFLAPWLDSDFEQGTYNGDPTLHMTEQYPGAFEKIYKGRKGYMYELDPTKFEWGPQLMRSEFMSKEVPEVLGSEELDVYEAMLAEEAAGRLKLHRYNDKTASDKDFAPDLTPDDLKALGVYDQVYGDAPSEASMKEWPEHWINKQDPLGWLQWYDRYSGGRRTDDDERQMKRWKSFKARHLAQYLKKPTPRRAAALRNWGIDVEKY